MLDFCIDTKDSVLLLVHVVGVNFYNKSATAYRYKNGFKHPGK